MHKNTKFWQFTWETNVKQKRLPNLNKLKNYFNSISNYCTFQLESGNLKSKQHFQGAFELSGPRISKKQLLSNFEEEFINVAGLTLTKARSMEDLIKYSSKEETRVEGPFHVGKKEVFDTEYSEMKLNTWQQDLFDFIKINRNDKDLLDRKIIWIEDKVGNTGKSFFQKWLRIGQKDIVARKLPVSTVDRLVAAVTKVTEHVNVELFMINLTKTQGSEQSLDDLFATCEQIKDGYLVDVLYGKYVEAIFKPPIILVFTNESLANYTNKLTQDRWLGLHITNDKEIEYYKPVEGGSITPIKLRNFKLKKD